MGCGSSSLKGDTNVGVNDPAPQPIKKVRTDFSTVDYGQDSQNGRRMTEFAPHETDRPKSKKESVAMPTSQSPSSPTAQRNGEGTALKPYQTLGDDNVDEFNQHQVNNSNNLASTQYPHETMNHQDPTSYASKNGFAQDNDPANPVNQVQQGHHHHQQQQNLNGANDNNNGERKRSWLGEKFGRNTNQLSDEELKQYTGKDRAELDEWAKTRAVGGNMPADQIMVGGGGPVGTVGM